MGTANRMEFNKAESKLAELIKEVEKEKPEMIKKLKGMYAEEYHIDKQIAFWADRKRQVVEDIDMMENIIMHQSNKMVRQKRWSDYKNG